MPAAWDGVPVTGGQYAAQLESQLDLPGLSAANVYRVSPLALVSTVTPPTVPVLIATVPPLGVGAGGPAPATATISSTRPSPDTTAIAGFAIGRPDSIRPSR